MAGRGNSVCCWAGSWPNPPGSRTPRSVGSPWAGCSLKMSKGTNGARAGQARWILGIRAGVRLCAGFSEVGEWKKLSLSHP